MTALGRAVMPHADSLKRLLTREQGKPHAKAEAEMLGAGYWLMRAAGLDLPVVVNEGLEALYSETRRVPSGVVGAIAAWNSPLGLAMFKIGPALLAGGDDAEQGTQIGPVNNKQQYARALELIQNAKDKGQSFLVGGDAADVLGYLIPVTILHNPPEDARIVQEEQFGPILLLLKFTDDDDVIARANATDYGLAGSVWGRDEDRTLRTAQQIASGTVWINETPHLSPTAAFGEAKQPGVGVEGGVEGLLEYINAQTVVCAKTRQTED